MDEKDKDKVVLRALEDLLVRDVEELCLSGNFAGAESMAAQFIGKVKARKMIADARRIV